MNPNIPNTIQALIERLSSEDAWSQLLLLCVKFLVLQSLRLLSAMLAAAVLRRHLMVWKIFAPRSVYRWKFEYQILMANRFFS